MNTRFTLMYRDAANYKTTAEAVVAGRITEEQIAAIKSKLQDGEFAITREIGFPTPSEESFGEDGLDEDLDHVFTTMTNFSDGLPTVESMLTDDAPTVEFDINDLAAKFAAVVEWDVSSEWSRMMAGSL